MITFIHTADIHFGMENYGRIDPITGVHSRLTDFERALNCCIDHAIEHEVDFFLFSGDAYKTASPSPTQQKLLLNCFLRLYNKKIPVVIVIGNHDNPLSFGKANALDIFGQLPVDGFHVISKPKTIQLSTKGGPINIVGIPWPTRTTLALQQQQMFTTTSALTEYISTHVGKLIRTLAESLDQTIPAVLAAHLTVSSGIFSGSEKRAIYGSDPIFLPSQLAIPPFDYVALGHLHRHQNLNAKGYPSIVYSGSIERIDFGERKEEKGFCFVTIKEKGSTFYTFIKTPTRPFIQVDVHLQTQGQQTEQILHAIAQHDIKEAIVKIVYHIPEGKNDTVDLYAVQKALSESWYCAGIIPIYKQVTRERRASMKINMSLERLLDTYFDQKENLKEKKKDLIEKALFLREQLHEKELE
jgi:DNA repair protein SbcD/Mre11